MRYQYPVPFEMTFLLKDGKRPASRKAVEYDEVDIPEISRDEAPVAARWRETGARCVDRHVRIYDGKFYQPFYLVDGDPTLSTTEALSRIFPDDRPETMPSPETVAYRLGDSQANSRQFRRERAEGLLLVDGVLHRRCTMPVLALDHKEGAGYYRQVVVVEWTRTYGGHEPLESRTVFPLTDIARMEEVIGRLPPRNAWTRFENLFIHLPDELQFDEGIEACSRVVAQAIWTNYNSFHQWPPASIAEFLDVRDRYREWLRDPQPEDVVELFERMYALFSSDNLYNQKQVAVFLANCEKARSMSADSVIGVRLAPNPLDPGYGA